MTLKMIDIAFRGSMEAPGRFPENLEVFERNTRVSNLASKIHTNSPVYFSFLLYIVRWEVKKLMTSILSGTLSGDSTTPLQTISIIIRVILSHFKPGNPGNPVGQANKIGQNVRLTYWVPWVPRLKMEGYDLETIYMGTEGPTWAFFVFNTF